MFAEHNLIEYPEPLTLRAARATAQALPNNIRLFRENQPKELDAPYFWLRDLASPT